MRAKTKKTVTSLQNLDVSMESDQRRIKFEIAAPSESDVAVAGTFNNWDPKAHRMKLNGNGTFVTTLALPPGRHEYKFVINGVWQVDSNQQQWVPNDQGSLNSVIEVG